jgi:hypothetical protein
MNLIASPTTKDYAEYWEAQVIFVRLLQNSGLKVGVKDRLPLFKLRLLIDARMTGVRKEQLIKLLDLLVSLRTKGLEPPHKGNKYT